ncbi:MAG TPA: hydrogenase expression/formation protein HypE [Gammaproteobacteria bacterium]|nr:hydrogenase expression/formation protein HypE [Gammaproteobacteria bacterium]
MAAKDSRIALAHGNGGRFMRELIRDLFAARLANPALDVDLDAVAVPLDATEIMLTTDGFTVQPLEFPGGNIGSLAIHGTVNDLAVAGALPRYLTLNAIIEEGTEMALLERVVDAMAAAAAECGVAVVAGDTKVVGRGECGGVYLATTGIGLRLDGPRLGPRRIRPGDRVLVSGPVGDHGAAVLLAREQFGMHGELRSDAASVLPAAQALLRCPGLRFMRDPTRGGLATVANEITRMTGLGLRLDEAAIPVSDPVAGVCELLGYDPLYLACEGRIVAIVAADEAGRARDLLEGSGAAPAPTIIGTVGNAPPGVVLQTTLGGERMLDELEDDPLPRIC